MFVLASSISVQVSKKIFGIINKYVGSKQALEEEGGNSVHQLRMLQRSILYKKNAKY